jgi:hypothetical protein
MAKTKRRGTKGVRGAEARKRLVAALALRRLTVREMAAELAAEGEATDKVLAIQRQRGQFLRIGPGAGGRVAAEAGAGVRDGERGPVTAVKVRVELVDDWRDA